MVTIKKTLILKKNDYDLLLKYVYSTMHPLSVENKNAEQLYEELKSAKIYENDEDIPDDVIRINSKVVVQEQENRKILRFKIVLPEQANLSKEKLSVFKPLGIALMGYRKGQVISWEMPAGKKVFYIKNVVND